MPSQRCDACHKVVTDAECLEWSWPVEWFVSGERMAKTLAGIGEKKVRPKKRKYHRKYGRRNSWEAKGREMICGLVRESHPDEDAFDHLLSLMRH